MREEERAGKEQRINASNAEAIRLGQARVQFVRGDVGMSIRKREGNRPGRRIAPENSTTEEARRQLLKRIKYSGSANHKLHPGDYGFVPTQNPRPSKTPCDELRSVLLAEATALFAAGIERGMMSAFPQDGVPKYVWAVDQSGEPYEAKTKPETQAEYHGYRIGEDDRHMREYVIKEWNRRCPKD